MHYFCAIMTNRNAHYYEAIQTYVFQPAIFTAFSVYIIESAESNEDVYIYYAQLPIAIIV